VGVALRMPVFRAVTSVGTLPPLAPAATLRCFKTQFKQQPG
jgi:hypothetical protein